MAYSQIIILGNVGNDPEVRYTPDGTPVTNLRMAVTKVIGDKGGQRDLPSGWKDGYKSGTYELTTWYDVTFWRNDAENIGKYVSKGDQLFVVGETGGEPEDGTNNVRIWEDKNGNSRASHEITCNRFQFISNRNGGNGGNGGSRKTAPKSQQKKQTRQADVPDPYSGLFDDM